MPRLYRAQPDSSTIQDPRVFVRVFAPPGLLSPTVDFYRALTSAPVDMDMEWPEAQLHLVAVGAFLIIELDPSAHEQAAATTTTVLVAGLDDAVAEQVRRGAEIVQSRWEAPVGAGALLRHPDGLLVEYVEHRPSPHDVARPGPQFS